MRFRFVCISGLVQGLLLVSGCQSHPPAERSSQSASLPPSSPSPAVSSEPAYSARTPRQTPGNTPTYEANAPVPSASSSGVPDRTAQSAAPADHSKPKPRPQTSKPLPAATPPAAPEAARPSSPATPALDLSSLEQRLRDSKAIGLFSKLTLKNQVDDLLSRFRLYYSGRSNVTLTQLRQSYDLLLLKVLSLLQDKDASLANAISSSREAIWDILINPKKFAAIT